MARNQTNPEKLNVKRLSHKKHRIIIPFYIPDTTQAYWESATEVFSLSLESLFATIDPSVTNVTLINNASCDKAGAIALRYCQKGVVDKYIICSENRGKVEPCLSQVRASYEDFVTIVDADVLFFKNWEWAVFDVFNNFPRAGAVSAVPAPNLAYYNNSAFFLTTLFRPKRVRLEKAVSDADLMLFCEGVSNPTIYDNNKRAFSWLEKQVVITNRDRKACVGCGHFFTTYRRALLELKPKERIEFAFKNGLELNYFDRPIDEYGYYRLSTTKTYAYHLGNTIPEWAKSAVAKNDREFVIEMQTLKRKRYLVAWCPLWLRCKLVNVLKTIGLLF